jgi:dihydropyrimidine dehydrogenase (NAD+) subunit PreT
MAEFKRPASPEDLNISFSPIKPHMNATMAYYESSRCLFCFDAPCVKACPTGIDIPLFIRQIHSGNLTGAAKTIYAANYLGHACGQACPTEELCEGACVFNEQDVKPIEIGRLQSYATTAAMRNEETIFKQGKPNGFKVAVVGAGPAGISCASELRSLGYEVVLFESKAMPSGLAIHGVAPYKISNEDVIGEIDYLNKQLGFQIHYNRSINTVESFSDLEREYHAIFLGVGLGPTRLLSIQGESLPGSIGAVEFIEKVKLDPLHVDIGQVVVVIGGGNTAMDAASEAARLGAQQVYLIYRRSKEEMKAYEFEYRLAKSVGVTGLFNWAPVRIVGEHAVEAILLVRTSTVTGEIRILEEETIMLPCDMVIRASGQEKFRSLAEIIPGLELDTNNCIKVTEENHQTTNPKYFAGGDAVNGGLEVVHAVAEGKKAAKGIDEWLFSKAEAEDIH